MRYHNFEMWEDGPTNVCAYCNNGPNHEIHSVAAAIEACAMLHESVNPANDDERLNNVPGAGAMGAVIEYRDKIRTLSKDPA